MKRIKRNYFILIVLDVLFSIVHIINIIPIGDSMDLGGIPLAIVDLAFCLIYMIIHGIATYCAYRQVLYPHFITGVIISISTIFLLLWHYDVEKSWTIGASVFLCGFFIISLIISFITMLIFKLCARVRRQANKSEQSGDGDLK